MVGLLLGTVISGLAVWPTAIAMGSILPFGPAVFFLAIVAAAFLIVWPVTMLAARLAMKPKPFDAISRPGQ